MVEALPVGDIRDQLLAILERGGPTVQDEIIRILKKK
jgi:hypothetical protein